MKKKYLLILLLVLAFVIMPETTFASDKITITVDGKEIKPDVDPFLHNDRTMVPVRFIAEALGMDVDFKYDFVIGAEKDLIVTLKEDNGRTMTINKIYMYTSDGMTYDEPEDRRYDSEYMIVKNDRTFIPIRHLANALNLDIDWDNDTRTVIIKSNSQPVEIPIYETSFNMNTATKSYSKTPFKAVFRDGNYYVVGTDLTVGQFLIAKSEDFRHTKNSYYGDTTDYKSMLNPDIKTLLNQYFNFGPYNSMFKMEPEKDRIVGEFLV